MRTKNAVYNLAASLILTLVTAVSGLLLPRLFISNYGSVTNGLISSVKQFIEYLALVEAGIGYAAIAMLYVPIKENNYKGINRILSAAKIQYKKSGKLFLVLILILSCIYPFIVKDQIEWMTAFFMILVLGIGGISEFFLIGKYRVFLTAAQKGYIVYMVQAFGVALNILITVLLITMNINPVLLQLVVSVIFVSRFIFLKLYLEKNFSWIDYRSSLDDKILDNRWDVLVHQVVNLVLVNTPIIIITIVLGLKEVSVFVVYLLVHNMMVMFLSVFMNGFQSIFGDIIAEKNKDILIKNFHLYEWLFFSFVSIIYVVGSLLYVPFIELYTVGISDANYIQPSIAFLFIIIGVLHNLRLPYMSILNSAGLFKETRNAAITEAFLSLILSVFLVNILGIQGVLLGWTIAYMFRIVILIKQISVDYIYGTVYPTLKLLLSNTLFAIISFFVCKMVTISGITTFSSFVINGGVYLIITSILIAGLNYLFYKEEFLQVLEKVYKFKKSR